MLIEQRAQDGCAVVSLYGQLHPGTAARLRYVLLKRLADRPLAVICDLSGLTSIDPASAAVFSGVANHPSSSWPSTSLLLCGARAAVAAVLSRLRMPSFLPMYRTVEEAIGNAAARPPFLREELVLGQSPAAPAAARRWVEETCRSWRLDEPAGEEGRPEAGDLVERAVLAANELVTNAVVHGAGQLRLRLELQGERLLLAVHDATPRLLRAAPPAGAEAEGGRGLLLVERLATAWGVQPERDGKLVWCLLDR